jgi:hypothetical protein
MAAVQIAEKSGDRLRRLPSVARPASIPPARMHRSATHRLKEETTARCPKPRICTSRGARPTRRACSNCPPPGSGSAGVRGARSACPTRPCPRSSASSGPGETPGTSSRWGRPARSRSGGRRSATSMPCRWACRSRSARIAWCSDRRAGARTRCRSRSAPGTRAGPTGRAPRGRRRGPPAPDRPAPRSNAEVEAERLGRWQGPARTARAAARRSTGGEEVGGALEGRAGRASGPVEFPSPPRPGPPRPPTAPPRPARTDVPRNPTNRPPPSPPPVAKGPALRPSRGRPRRPPRPKPRRPSRLEIAPTPLAPTLLGLPSAEDDSPRRTGGGFARSSPTSKRRNWSRRSRMPSSTCRSRMSRPPSTSSTRRVRTSRFRMSRSRDGRRRPSPSAGHAIVGLWRHAVETDAPPDRSRPARAPA